MALSEKWQNKKEEGLAYWQKREEQYFASYLSEQKEVEARLKQYFQSSKANIADRVNGFYGKYADKEGITIAEAKKRAERFDVENFSKTVGDLIRQGNLTEQAEAELRLYNLTIRSSRLELLHLKIDLEMVKLYSDLELDMEGTLFREIEKEFERQSGIMRMSIGQQPEWVKKVADGDFHGETWSKRIWGEEHASQLRKEVARIVESSLIQGRNPHDFEKELALRMNVKNHEAYRLLNTEINRVNTATKKESYEQAAVEEYDYYAEPTACPICAELDGQRFPVSEMTAGVNAKPMHPYCYCGVLPVSTRTEWLARLGEEFGTEG